MIRPSFVYIQFLIKIIHNNYNREPSDVQNKIRKTHIQDDTFFHLTYFAFRSLFKGEILFKNSVSNPNAVAYGSVLSMNRGSSFNKSFILFSSQLFIKFLYPIRCEAKLAHFSVNFSFHHPYTYHHIKIQANSKITKEIRQ